MIFVEVAKKTSRTWDITAGMLTAVLLALAPGTAYAQSEVRPVRTVVATARTEGEPVSLTGHIRARTEESLAFRIDGRVIMRRVDVGDIVKPGELVAELDAQPKQDALRAARAKHESAQATLHDAANNLERQRILVAQGWSTRVKFDDAQKTFLAAKADVDATAADLHAAEDQLGYTKLLADASGPVIAKGAEAGEVVKAGQMIVTVALDDGADAVFDVPASLMRQVSPDVEITIALTDDPKIRTVGRVRETAPQADPVTRSYRVKVGLTERPEAMRLGATVTGQATMRAPGGIELPATALTMCGQQAGRLGGRSRKPAGVAATCTAAAPGLCPALS